MSLVCELTPLKCLPLRENCVSLLLVLIIWDSALLSPLQRLQHLLVLHGAEL